MPSEMTRKTICLALPLAYQDGRNKYVGFQRYVAERDLPWTIRLEREFLTPERVKSLRADGIDTLIIDGGHPATLLRLAGTTFPNCVVLDCSDHALFASPSGRTLFIGIDSEELGRQAADLFLSRVGAASFAFVGHDAHVSWSVQREASFRQRLGAAGQDCPAFRLPYQNHFTPAVRSRLANFLRGLPKPACVLAACDRLSRLVADVADETGLPIPNEISLLGVDNEEITCTLARPTLSSLEPDFTALGYEAARLLDLLLATGDCPPDPELIAGARLVERESTAPSYSAAHLVNQAKELIRGMSGVTPRIPKIARALGVSRRLLDLRFRELTGDTVLAFIRQERIGQIKDLLTQTDLPVGDICRRSGFRSVNHLKRVFKAATGQTMTAWRKAQH